MGSVLRRPVRLLLIAAAAVAAATAGTAPASAAKPSFEARGGSELQPEFRWRVRDYAARCDSGLRLRVAGASGWRTQLPGAAPRPGSFTHPTPLDPGEGTTVAFERRDGRASARFHVRCLPADFPEYRFRRIGPGGANLFMVQIPNRYAAIFDGDGVPIWWMQADGTALDAKLLPDGTVAWDSVSTVSGSGTGAYDVLSLSGRPLRSVGREDTTDVHDLQVLPSGNYVIARQTYRSGVDTTAYGGSASALLLDFDIEEVTPDGDVVRTWSTADHIGLDETGRWWEAITGGLGYDITHWNAVEVDGRYMYLSFRHLDAIYKVDRRTGEIVWKLGGTETPESLEVRGDPREYPIGGQHDVRVQPNGTVTIHNNRTNLADPIPRAERFRIDEEEGTAKLVESITDPKVPTAQCCGSARRLGDGTWLVAWGRNEIVGAYGPDGDPLYRFRVPGSFSYRANTVPEDIGAGELRRAMDRMAARAAG
ncbi:MAG: aryl-sulfate sulfotransferase [Solirubrobacterales bacterium]